MTRARLETSHPDAPDLRVEPRPVESSVRESAARRALASAQKGLYWSGASTLYARAVADPAAAILTYHSVLAPGEEAWIDPANALSADQFERQMRFIARRRCAVSMDQLVGSLEEGRPFRRGTVAITFDDGYLDVLTTAAPILQKYNLPAMVYLPTAFTDSGKPQWIDRLYSAFRFRTRDSLWLPGAFGPGESARLNGHVAVAYRELNRHFIEAQPAARDVLLDEVDRQLGPARKPPRLTMNWDDVRRLLSEFPLMDVGVHTCDHVDLTACDDDEIVRQITTSVAAVERELGQRPQHFAFPYDRSDDRSRRAARACGLRSAVGTSLEGIVLKGTDRFALPRISTGPSQTRLRYATSGAYPGLPRLLFRRQ